MSSKAFLQPAKIASNQSLSATVIFPVTIVQTQDNISYQINITTSDSIGSFTLQASLDYTQDPVTKAVTNSGTWVDLTLGGGSPQANASNDTINIAMNQVPFPALRIKYTSITPGTGTCDMWVTAKRLGG